MTRTTMGESKTVRFMKHYVTNGDKKARVYYSVSTYTDGTVGVMMYAKSHKDGDLLVDILPALYQNNTDIMTDYFEKGKVRIPKGHPLYEAALARAQEVR